MKKIISAVLAMVMVLSLAACGSGPSAGQTITFQGITMNIPKNWKVQKKTLSDDYAIYEKTNAKGHDYKLLLTDTFGLLDIYGGDMERAGASFKETTEDDASYLNPSDPVAGKFAGKYDMHVIDCTYHVLNPLKGGEAEYPCKLIRIYMDGHDVKIHFSSEKGDFDAFDAAIAGAVCG